MEIGNPEEKKKEFGKWDKYEIENAVETLVKAEKIKADSEMMKYVGPQLKKHGMAHKQAINSISDLRAKSEELSQEESDAGDEE